MTEDIKRVIATDGTIKYEYITYTSSLPKDVQSEELRENHKYDWCIKKAFEQLPYFGSFSFKNPKYGFYIPKYKTVYDRYFSKEMKLEDNLSERIRVQYEPKKSGKTTSGNEFSSGKFYSVASSSRLAVTSFTQQKDDKLDYVDEITINRKTEKILEIEFEHDTPVKGINSNSHCPQLDVYFKTKTRTYFIEVKNHEILDSYKQVELSPSYMNTESFAQYGLNRKSLFTRDYKDNKGKVHKYISLIEKETGKKDFLTASDFGCDLKTYHFDFKQFLCHLMGIWSYAEEHPEEEIYFYYLVYRNKLYEESFDKKLYKELEKEVNTIFKVFKKLFPQIHFGLCYNNKYDTLEELQNIL